MVWDSWYWSQRVYLRWRNLVWRLRSRIFIAGVMWTKPLPERTPGEQSHWLSEGPTPGEVAIGAELLSAMVHALLSLRLIFISEDQENSKLNFQVTRKYIQNIALVFICRGHMIFMVRYCILLKEWLQYLGWRSTQHHVLTSWMACLQCYRLCICLPNLSHLWCPQSFCHWWNI